IKSEDINVRKSGLKLLKALVGEEEGFEWAIKVARELKKSRDESIRSRGEKLLKKLEARKKLK
ncbi:hypothetical protein KAT08_04320, partial [Candidatus Babeliales bacterium]|nr:hypothetical protein [Candidatus Babeliales bacterium]